MELLQRRSAPTRQLAERHPRSDIELVDAVLNGDDAAYAVLVDRESDAVIGHCRRVVRDHHEAEDVAQEAFVRAYRALPTFRGDGPFGAWVFRIAMRLANARRKQRPSDLTLDEALPGGWLEDRDHEADPELRCIRGERASELLAAVRTLPAAQRQAVSLRYYGGLSIAEVAACTRVPEGTVKSRLHRALANLQDSLERHGS